MKTNDWDAALLAAHRAHLTTDSSREAFDVLVSAGAASGGYECKPGFQGVIRAFYFRNLASGGLDYAFIINRADLLFYFRLPSHSRILGGLQEVRRNFPGAAINRAGEWTLHVADAETARQLVDTVVGGPVSESSVTDRPGIPSYWWVNHKQTHRQEVEGGYLWSPKANQNGGRNQTYDNMTLAQPGDVVFSYAGGFLRAVGVVTAKATTAPKPTEFGEAGTNWGPSGWRLPVRFSILREALRPKNHMDVLAPLLPKKHSPIRASGDGNQGIYLASLPPEMGSELNKLLAGAVEAVEDLLPVPPSSTETEHLAESTDDEVESEILQRSDLSVTEKKTLIDSRRGQGLFRARVLELEDGCRVTGVVDSGHLRASHIKPWKSSTDEERLDGNNGLALAPHVDHLFDQGYISFTDVGDILVSGALSPSILKAWGISESLNVGPFRLAQQPFLAYHRSKVYQG